MNTTATTATATATVFGGALDTTTAGWVLFSELGYADLVVLGGADVLVEWADAVSVTYIADPSTGSKTEYQHRGRGPLSVYRLGRVR